MPIAILGLIGLAVIILAGVAIANTLVGIKVANPMDTGVVTRSSGEAITVSVDTPDFNECQSVEVIFESIEGTLARLVGTVTMQPTARLQFTIARANRIRVGFIDREGNRSEQIYANI